MILYLDLETYCETPIKHGTHRYAEGVEVLLTAYAIDEGPVTVDEGLSPALPALVDEADTIVIHNSKFDRVVLEHCQLALPVSKIWDTMAQARTVGLPGSLGQLCDILHVPTDKAKDAAGKKLIQLFCKPQPANRKIRRATRETHPAEWQAFREYAALDILAMRELFKSLPKWNYRGRERELWELDQKINDRGFAIDLELARTAIDAVLLEQKRLANEMHGATHGAVESAMQRDKLIAHLLGEYGVTLPDMKKGTLERRIYDEELPLPVRELLAIRLEASGTSTAKYSTLVDATSSDGRLRGGLEFCGAARTGRWSGRLFQPQNLPRPKYKGADLLQSIEAVKLGIADILYDDVIARASSAIRGAIIAPPGRKLVWADLSNIEGRVLAWLAGEEWKVKAFADFDAGTGHDLYVLAYARSFSVDPDTVDKDKRQLGKVQELALGYQGSVGAFASMAALYGVELPVAEVKKIVDAWRKAHKKVVELWHGLEEAAILAVADPKENVEHGRLILRREGQWLRIALPSGRELCYASPKILEGKLTYMGINQYTRKWERMPTYGGKLVENVTQAVARDVIADAMPRAEAAGYEVILTVHDEIVTETPDTPAFTAEGLSVILATNPEWAAGLPLAAAGEEAKRYGK